MDEYQNRPDHPSVVDEGQSTGGARLPDANRLSVLSATILLAYALAPFVTTTGQDLTINLPGMVFVYHLNPSTLVSVLVAALAAVGMDWLLHQHPQHNQQKTFQHWLLPGLTAWVIGVPLNSLKVSPAWWAVFTFGGVLLILVFVAEYISVDLTDALHAPAMVGLTAVSFGLYLILAIAVRAADLRIYLMVPALVLAMGLVTLRTLNLRLGGHWRVSWAIGIALIIGQIAIGLHYWPIEPLAFGLVLLGPAYALTSMVGALEEGRSWRTLWIEPGLMLVAIWGLAGIFSR